MSKVYNVWTGLLKSDLHLTKINVDQDFNTKTQQSAQTHT